MRNKTIKLLHDKIDRLREQKECAIDELQAKMMTEDINELKNDLRKGKKQ